MARGGGEEEGGKGTNTASELTASGPSHITQHWKHRLCTSYPTSENLNSVKAGEEAKGGKAA